MTRADLVALLERHATYTSESDDRLWIPVETAADLIVDGKTASTKE